jgi:predicted PurR-regulated permease PerM
MNKTTLEISWSSLWRILFFILFVTVFYLGRQVVLGLFLAIIISSGVEGIVDAFERVGLPRSVGVILIFLITILGIIALAYSIVPFVIVELNTIFAGVGKTASTTGSLGLLLSLRTSQSAASVVDKLSSQFFSGNGTPLNFFSDTLGGFGLAISVIFSSFYLSLSHDGVERFIKVITPPSYEETVLRIYTRSRKKIGYWFRAQIILSILMGFLVGGVLTLLGVPYAFLIGCLAGIFELVPFIGPIISGAIGIVSALAVSPTLAIYTLIFFLAAQQLESNILVPLFNKRAVDLHPVIVIVALLIGAEVGGFLGIVIAVPAAAVFQEMIQDWSSRQRAVTMAESQES